MTYRARHLPSDQIIYRVMRICIAENTGACFCYNRNGKEYIVTANHVAKDFDESDPTVSFLLPPEKDGFLRWAKSPVKLIGRSEETDVFVYCYDEARFNSNFDIPISSTDDSILGEPLWFFGFPFDLTSAQLEDVLVFPFTKGCNLSYIHGDFLYLDGSSNPGFSGGPVVRCTESEVMVLGVVSCGFSEEAGGEGIIRATAIECVNELIDNNPIGPKILRD